MNVVGYISPTERLCHWLRAQLGLGYISKFGTGVAFKMSDASNQIKEKPVQFRYDCKGAILGLNLGGTTMLSSLADEGFFVV